MDLPANSDETPAPARGRIPRAGLVVVGVIVALIAIAVAVVVAGPNGPTTYEAGSPEAAFQEHYRAYEEGDLDRAHALFSSSVKEQLTLSEYRRLDAEHGWQRDEDRRVVLLRTEVTGDRASLHLRIDHFSGGGLGAARNSQERTTRLVREGGAWLIDEPLVGVEYASYGF